MRAGIYQYSQNASAKHITFAAPCFRRNFNSHKTTTAAFMENKTIFHLSTSTSPFSIEIRLHRSTT